MNRSSTACLAGRDAALHATLLESCSRPVSDANQSRARAIHGLAHSLFDHVQNSFACVAIPQFGDAAMHRRSVQDIQRGS